MEAAKFTCKHQAAIRTSLQELGTQLPLKLQGGERLCSYSFFWKFQPCKMQQPPISCSGTVCVYIYLYMNSALGIQNLCKWKEEHRACSFSTVKKQQPCWAVLPMRQADWIFLIDHTWLVPLSDLQLSQKDKGLRVNCWQTLNRVGFSRMCAGCST